eukprot:1799810-Pleurochrysis_carterae.AAC.12
MRSGQTHTRPSRRLSRKCVAFPTHCAELSVARVAKAGRARRSGKRQSAGSRRARQTRGVPRLADGARSRQKARARWRARCATRAGDGAHPDAEALLISMT